MMMMMKMNKMIVFIALSRQGKGNDMEMIKDY